MLLPESLRPLRAGPEGPETLCECPAQLVATSRNLSGLVGTSRNLSELVATCRNLSELVWSPVALRAGPWVPILKDFQA